VTGGVGTVGEKSRARLDTMRTTYDGYAIAEQDLIQRGPGDFLGSSSGNVRQSGGLAFRLADAGEDASILTDATADARALLSASPSLSSHPTLASRVFAMFDLQEGLIS
jgi:ATP-dependent DNA helicase RecG